MTLDKLKNLAKSAMTNAMDGPDDWYDADTVEQFLCGEGTELGAPYIAAMSPATTLKLLQMIAVLQEGLKIVRYRNEIALPPNCDLERVVGESLGRAAIIERSL